MRTFLRERPQKRWCHWTRQLLKIEQLPFIQAIVVQADTRARALAPMLAEIRATGVHSYSGIAAQLNAPGVPTARGGRCAATQVRDIVLRLSNRPVTKVLI